jgi:hypothetical protein
MKTKNQANTPTFNTFELAFDWIRENNAPAYFIVEAAGTRSGQVELWKGYPSGRGEFIGKTDASQEASAER